MMISKIERLLQQIDDLHGNYNAILPLTIQLVDLTKIHYGPKSTECAIAINDLASVYRYLGSFGESEQLFKEALEILSSTIDVKDPNITTVLNNLAGLYRLTHNFDQAEKLFLTVIDDYQSTLGNSHFLTLSAKNNLGLVYQDMQRFDEALQLHQTCLIELEPQKLEHPVAYATTLSNIASVYGQIDQIPKAIDISQSVLLLYQKQVGDQHPLYANILNNLASLYYQAGDLEQAKILFTRAKVLNYELFGPASDVYQTTLNNIDLIDSVLQKTTIKTKKFVPELLIENVIDSLLNLINQPQNPSKIDSFGMNLCHRYFEQICFPALQQLFSSSELERMAMGLVGEGSECFGFDDQYSEDHDFGPRIMIWLTDEDYALLGQRLQELLNTLPTSFEGYQLLESEWGQNRSGIFTINEFYQRYIGLSQLPQSLTKWRSLPENNLATVTNGSVFYDPLGKFSSIRTGLLKGYPEDIRLKKIAARLMTIAQSGQYNFVRSLKRNDLVAMNACCAEFIDAGISLVFLLNNRYKPFYKWMHRATQSLPILGNYSYSFFIDFMKTALDMRAAKIEIFCAEIIQELKRQKLSDCSSGFLLDHGPVVLQNIQDIPLKQSNPWVE